MNEWKAQLTSSIREGATLHNPRLHIITIHFLLNDTWSASWGRQPAPIYQ